MKNKNLIYIILGIIVVAIIFVFAVKIILEPTKETAPYLIDTKQEEIIKETITHMVNIRTNKGDIKIELFSEDTPITVDNFVSLAEKGFYDGMTFHRVIKGFMIQGGCPLGTGMGGPGHTIKCEFAGYNQNTRGTIAMANAGPNTGGSQFFINLNDNHFLNNRHTVFGRVIEGMEIVDAIGEVETGPGDRPLEDVIIEGMGIIQE